MSTEPVKQVLVEGRGAHGGWPGGAAKPWEVWPATLFKGEQAAMDELQRELRVSVDVEAVARPGAQSQDYGGDFGDIIGQRHAGKAKRGMDIEV